MPATDKPTNIRWVVFALACSTSWLLYLHRYSLGFIKKRLADEWHLSKTELGWLDSAFALPSTGFQMPLGIAADALGVHLVLTGLVLLWCVGLGLNAVAPSPAFLWPARAIMGTGQSAVYACLSRLAQTWFPARVRTTLQGIAAITCGRVGGLMSNVLLGTVLLGLCGLPWRMAILIFAGGGVAFAVLFAWLFRNSPREHPWASAAEAELIGQPAVPPPRMTVRKFVNAIRPAAAPSFGMLNLQTILSTFADNVYSHWMPLFLAEVYLLGETRIGLLSALPLLGGALSGVAGGMLNDACIRWTGNRRWSRVAIAFCGKGLAAIILLVALVWYQQPLVFCGFLLAAKFFGDWSLTTSWGVVTDIGGRATASAFAFNNTVAGLGLIAAGPIFGHVAQHYGWPWVFVTVAAAYALCALCWLAIDCTQPLLAEPQQP